jgi:hypothetical protein
LSFNDFSANNPFNVSSNKAIEKVIDLEILQKFNQACSALQNIIINHTTGLNEAQQQIITNYLAFFRLLMEVQHRGLFARSEIKLNSADLQAIGSMLKINSASINDNLIENYMSLLRLSFDVPELLAKYEIGLGVLPLAKACFLNKAINIHIATTRFFDVLGYQGQLLDYYQHDPKFNINDRLLAEATDDETRKALRKQCAVEEPPKGVR